MKYEFTTYKKVNQKIHIGSRDIADMLLYSENLFKVIIKKFLNIKQQANNSMYIGLLLEGAIKKHCMKEFSVFSSRDSFRSTMFRKMINFCTFMAQADVFFIEGDKRVICEIKCKSVFGLKSGIMTPADFLQILFQYTLGQCTELYYLKVTGVYESSSKNVTLSLYKLQINEVVKRLTDTLLSSLCYIGDMIECIYKVCTSKPYIYKPVYETDPRQICKNMYGGGFVDYVEGYAKLLNCLRGDLKCEHELSSKCFVKIEELLIDRKEIYSKI